MKIKNLITTILVVSMSLTSALAESVESVSFSYSVITWGAKPLSGVAVKNSDDMENIYAPIDQRSESYRYHGPKEVSFYSTAGKEDIDAPLAKITAHEEWSEVLFLSLQDEPSGRLRILPIDDSLSAHPQNSIRLMNLSGQTIGGMVGREKVILTAGDDQSLPLASEASFIPLQFARKGDGVQEWQRFLSTAIPPRRDSRILVIFYPSKQEDLSGETDISFKVYYDSPKEQKFSRLN